MYYTYILKQVDSYNFYIGYTSNLKLRIKQHNLGLSKATQGKKWFLYCYFVFREQKMAENFELYLKSHSGRSFAKRHFLAESF